MLSIIIPCYNSEKYIKGCLDSCLNNKYKFEIICINDGSTDDTLNILNDYKLKYNNIRVLSKQNGGYVSAIKLGILNAKFNYIMFMGSDDILLNNIIDNVCEEIITNKPDYICFNAQLNKKNQIQKDPDSCIEKYIFEGNISFSDLIKKYTTDTKIIFHRDTCKCFKKSLNIQYFGKYGIYGDDTFSIMNAASSYSFSFLPITGYQITIREDSISYNEVSGNKRVDSIYCLIKLVSFINKKKLNKIPNSYLQKYFNKLLSLLYNAICKDRMSLSLIIATKKVLFYSCFYCRTDLSKNMTFCFLFPILYKIVYKIKYK